MPADDDVKQRSGEAGKAANYRRDDPVSPLAGSPVPVAVEEVLVERSGEPRLFAGHTPDGQRWLVAQIAESTDLRRWLCAPASDRAIGCVTSGRALPADLLPLSDGNRRGHHLGPRWPVHRVPSALQRSRRR